MNQSDCIESFLEITKNTLQSVGLKHDESSALSALIVDALAGEWGGMLIYFSKRHAERVKVKNDHIYEEWNAGGCKNIRLMVKNTTFRKREFMPLSKKKKHFFSLNRMLTRQNTWVWRDTKKAP